MSIVSADQASPAASFVFDRKSTAFSLDPRDPSFFHDPYPTYAALHRNGRFGLWRESGTIAIWDHGLVAALLKDRRCGRVMPADSTGRPDRSQVPEHVAAFQQLEDFSLLDLEPPIHTRLRNLVLRAFTSRSIAGLEPRIRSLAHELIDGFDTAGPVELVSIFAESLPITIIAELIGMPRDDSDMLLAWSHAMVAMYRFGRTRSVEDAANRASADFRNYLLGVIAAKRQWPANDLTSALIAAEANGARLTEPEMVSTLVLLLNAGHEATVHGIGNAVAAILRSGLEPVNLFSTDEAAEATVEEALRFDTPLHLFERVVFDDFELADGLRLKRGQRVGLLLGAANHDPSVSEAPQNFDPTRTPKPHVSFGGGIHFCLGAPLARLELQVALRTLFERLPNIRLAGQPAVRDSFHFRGLERLDLVVPAP